MPSTPATTYNEVIKFATRNVWTKHNAAGNIHTLLDQWRRGAFALEPNPSTALPINLQLLDQQVIDVVEDLPNANSTATDGFIPDPAANVIQRVAISFRDSENPTISGNVPLEAAFVAAFNAVWV